MKDRDVVKMKEEEIKKLKEQLEQERNRRKLNLL